MLWYEFFFIHLRLHEQNPSRLLPGAPSYPEAEARQPYHATVTVDTTSAMVSAPNLVNFKNELQTSALEKLIPFYNPTVPVAIGINLRGIELNASFAANSSTLVVTSSQLNLTQSFEGATRDESIVLLKDFIHDAGNHHQFLKAYARYSPIDPIAGNPNSLMAQMAQQDYMLGHLSPFSGCDCSWSAQPIVHEFQLGVSAGRAFSKGFDTTLVTSSLRYSYSPDLHWAFILDAPVTYFRNGGASSLYGSLGIGLRIPLLWNWSLTPSVRYGAGGSLDLCTAGSFFETGLTSVFNYKIDEYLFSLTNYAGYFCSPNLWLTGVNFNYNLHNYVFKNGLALTTCKGFCVAGRAIHLHVEWIDSCFTKDKLFIRHYDEIGFSLITTGLNPCLDYDCLSLGFSYQWGQKNYKGYFVNMAYQF